MADYREELLQSIIQSLIIEGIDSDILNTVTNVLISKIHNYEISERCTELVVVDSTSEKLVEYFIGTLMTEGKSKRTARAYKRTIMDFYHHINKPLTEANVFDFRSWFANQMKLISPRSCENYRSYLSSFYQFLLREELIERNPMLKIKPIKFHEKKKAAFSAMDLEAIRNACPTKVIRAEFEFLIASGVRVSELCDLNISDVNFNTKEVLIEHGKGDKERVVCVNDTALYYLQQYLDSRHDNSDILFLARGGHRVCPRTVQTQLKTLEKNAGVKNLHPHRCRVHFATIAYKKGMDLRSIQKLLGHSNIETTMGYIAGVDDKTKAEYHRIS